MLNHFTTSLGTLAALLGTLGTFGHVWKLLAFDSAVVACLSTGLADCDSKRPPASR